MTIRFKTPFVSTIFTPLDDRPLAESRHILITALARDKRAHLRKLQFRKAVRQRRNIL